MLENGNNIRIVKGQSLLCLLVLSPLGPWLWKILFVQFESILMDPSWLPRGEIVGRNDRIGTCDILYLEQRHYQATLHLF